MIMMTEFQVQASRAAEGMGYLDSGMRRFASLAILLALAACRRQGPPTPPDPSPPPRATSSAASPASRNGAPEALRAGSAGSGAGTAEVERPGLAPLEAETPLVDLPVEGHGPAVVSLPLGATDARPVLVATHGNYDRPEWTCAIWRDIVDHDGFVLCPRGMVRGDSPSPGDPRYQYATNGRLEKEIELALQALTQAYAQYVSGPPYVFAGFSQGAIMGVPILGRRPEWFDRAVLIEGGYDRWTKAGAAQYAEGGGRRILFACGQWACDQGYKAAQPWFEVAGIESRVVSAKGAGHTYGGPVAGLIDEAWGWVVADDERWHPQGRGPAPPPP